MGDRCPYCQVDLGQGIEARWELFIPLETPSQNAVAANKGGTRQRYKELRTAFCQLLMDQKVRKSIPRATRRRRVIFTRHYCGRAQERDRGNLVGGMKPLLDAMHRVGLLVDDAPEWVEDWYRQQRSTRSGTMITLEELCQ